MAAAVARGVVAALPKATPGGSSGAPVPPPMVKRKKLFLTDGYKVPLIGICIYMFRLNIGKQLPEEGFQKDLLVLHYDIFETFLYFNIRGWSEKFPTST